MAHTKSAVKRARQYAERRTRNNAAKSAMKTGRKELLDAMATGKAEVADKALRKYQSMLDKSSKRGIITRNTAIRKKTRAQAAVRKALAAKPAQPA